MSGKNKKRSKSFYINCSKRRKCDGNLGLGQRGFLLTCNNREKECVAEATDLLNEFAERLYGPVEGLEEKPSENDDIQDAVQKEIENLKKLPESTAWRFKTADTGTKNCVFIKTSLPDPCPIAHAIMTEVLTTQKQRARFICRFMPVSIVCKAHTDDIRKASAGLLEQHFKGTETEGKTFAVVFRARYNDSVKRDELIPTLAAVIQDLNPKNKANLNDPELAVVVEVLGKYSMIGVLSDYYRFRKYNLLELTSKPKTQKEAGQSEDQPEKVDKLETKEEKSVKEIETVSASAELCVDDIVHS